MKEFYIYSFKTDGEYNAKNSRSYDEEKRRMESYLGGYMGYSVPYGTGRIYRWKEDKETTA